MELDPRHYAQFIFTDDVLHIWRRHACLPRISPAHRSSIYTAASPFLVAVANVLVQRHHWRLPEPSSQLLADSLFAIYHPTDEILFTLPRSLGDLFTHATACARMFDTVFSPFVRLDAQDGRLYIPAPLTDIFHLLQLVCPGSFTLIKAEYASHEVDDDGEVAWIKWHTFARALPPPVWMDAHASQFVSVFGVTGWSALRRAAEDSEVLSSTDITFS